MQETYLLRKFQQNDLQDVIQINRICLPENYTDMFFVDLHERFPETFVVAEEKNQIIGYIMCRIEVGLSNFGFGGLLRKGHVVSIAVLPQWRQAAVDLYKKLGLEITRTISGYYSDGEDAHVMSKKL